MCKKSENIGILILICYCNYKKGEKYEYSGYRCWDF